MWAPVSHRVAALPEKPVGTGFLKGIQWPATEG